MAYNFEGITILVIEDNQAVKKLVCDVLKVFGVGNIIVASDGAEGFSRFVDYNPDIILTELVLDELDGPDLIEKIRQDEYSPNPYVPIIVLTAFSEMKRIERARDSGVNEIMTKPFTARDLYGRMAYVIENPRKFVITDDFMGPDRRRRKNTFYKGPRRREEDPIDSRDYNEQTPLSIYTGKQQRKKSSKKDRDKNNKDKGNTDNDIDIDFI